MTTHVLIPYNKNIFISVLNEKGERQLKLKLASEFFRGKSLKKELSNNETKKYPHAAIMRLPYGGNVFHEAVMWSEETKNKLLEISHDGFITAYFLDCIEEYTSTFHSCPLILAFETSFFVNLPAREAFYAIDASLAEKMRVRKYGFHGLYHEYACFYARQQLANTRNAKILSICLDPKTEVAAVIGNRPIMVSGGMTPLEGVPGETSCGRIDPAIVFEMITEHKLGIEEINELLCKKSGLSGIVGQQTALPEILDGKIPEQKLASDIFFYHLLQACGAGIAAMGGIDAIVFSGHYVDCSDKVAKQLVTMMKPSLRKTNELKLFFCKEELDTILFKKLFNILLVRGAYQTIYH